MDKDEISGLPEQVKNKIPDPEPKPGPNGFRIPVSYPFIPPDAKESVARAIDAGKISSATSVVRDFELQLQNFFGASFVKACSSGYSALLLALKLARIKQGDDVLIPSFTMAAVLNSVLAVGATPVFVDCMEGQFNPSVKQYEERMTPKSTALIVTHTYGVPADCVALQEFCAKKGLTFIEDIAEAIGTEYKGKLVGTFGSFACASLYANKTITAGDGGFIMCACSDKSEELLARANSYANHGFTKEFHFLHFQQSGNYKMSGLQAAFVSAAVLHIPEIMEDRARIASLYRHHLGDVSGLSLMPKNTYGKDAPWMFGVMVGSKQIRTRIRQYLADNGVESRNFFFPLHLQPISIKLSEAIIELPHSENLGLTGFYLPTYFHLKDDDIKGICECLKHMLEDLNVKETEK